MQEIDPSKEEVKEIHNKVLGYFENDFEERDRIIKLATKFQDKINKRDQIK